MSTTALTSSGSAAGFGLFAFPAASVDHQVAAFYAPEFCSAAANPSPPSSAGSVPALHQDSAGLHESAGESLGASTRACNAELARTLSSHSFPFTGDTMRKGAQGTDLS